MNGLGVGINFTNYDPRRKYFAEVLPEGSMSTYSWGIPYVDFLYNQEAPDGTSGWMKASINTDIESVSVGGLVIPNIWSSQGRKAVQYVSVGYDLHIETESGVGDPPSSQVNISTSMGTSFFSGYFFYNYNTPINETVRVFGQVREFSTTLYVSLFTSSTTQPTANTNIYIKNVSAIRL